MRRRRDWTDKGGPCCPAPHQSNLPTRVREAKNAKAEHSAMGGDEPRTPDGLGHIALMGRCMLRSLNLQKAPFVCAPLRPTPVTARVHSPLLNRTPVGELEKRYFARLIDPKRTPPPPRHLVERWQANRMGESARASNPPPPPESKTGGLTFWSRVPRGVLLSGHSTLLPRYLSRHRKILSPCL